MLPYRDSRIIRIILFVFFVILIGYGIFEAQGILYGPVISVPSGSLTASDQFTVIKGRAERITELRLNGKPVNVTENGEFEEPYLLAPGSNRIILEAKDARGRSATRIMDILYVPHKGTTQSTATSS